VCLGLESASGTQVVPKYDKDGPRRAENMGERSFWLSRGRLAIDTMTSTSPATNEATALAALTITVPFTDKKGASNSRSFLCSRLRSSSPSSLLFLALQSSYFPAEFIFPLASPSFFSTSASFFFFTRCSRQVLFLIFNDEFSLPSLDFFC